MKINDYLQEAQKFEIQAYKKPKELRLLKENHVAYSGTPRKHPHDPNKVILIVDPFSTNTFYYEFQTDDIAFVEELPSLVNLEGITLTMIRLWIKKKSVGIRCTPFVVEETGLTSNTK